MIQKIIVISLVILAVAFLFRKSKAALSGKSGCGNGCGCKGKEKR